MGLSLSVNHAADVCFNPGSLAAHQAGKWPQINPLRRRALSSVLQDPTRDAQRKILETQAKTLKCESNFSHFSPSLQHRECMRSPGWCWSCRLNHMIEYVDCKNHNDLDNLKIVKDLIPSMSRLYLSFYYAFVVFRLDSFNSYETELYPLADSA